MMEAGRSLDALIAEKVMGWHSGGVPHYSTSIGDAWLVIEYFRKQGSAFEIKAGFGSAQIEVSLFIVLAADDPRRNGIYGNWEYASEATSLPLAICLAALEAIEALSYVQTEAHQSEN